MSETQLYFIATSKIVEIRSGGSVNLEWGSMDAWKKLRTVTPKSTKLIKYDKTTKDKYGSASAWHSGGVTVNGTTIPSSATKLVDGVSRTVPVRYCLRGYSHIIRTSALTRQNKMQRQVFNNSTKAYQYRLQYKDKNKPNVSYCKFTDGKSHVFFDTEYQVSGQMVETEGHLLHPQTCELTYSDVRRNYDSSANNSDGRDNKGSYVVSNVRPNVVTLKLEWKGLDTEKGAVLLDVLNPDKKAPYLLVQFRDPASGSIENKTFVASEREVKKVSSGHFENISVTLTEV